MKHETVPVVVENLMKARARVAKAWVKRHFKVERPECFGGRAYCAFGALVENTGTESSFLKRALPAGFDWVISYNDHPSTTQADILALYDRAIELALAA